MPVNYHSLQFFLRPVHKVKRKIYTKNFSLNSANMVYLRTVSVKKPIVQQNTTNASLSFPRDITRRGKKNFQQLL